jgi:hypothetical protein
MSRNLSLLVLMATLALTSYGCFMTPRDKETVVLVKDGQPGVVSENVRVKVKFSDAGGTQLREQDIGGWVVMPKEHFDALMTKLKKLDMAREMVPVDVTPREQVK